MNKSIFKDELSNQLIDRFKDSLLESSIDEKYRKALYYVFSDVVVLSIKNSDELDFKSLMASDTVFEIKEFENRIQVNVKNTSTNKSHNISFSKEVLQDLQAFHLMNAEELA